MITLPNKLEWESVLCAPIAGVLRQFGRLDGAIVSDKYVFLPGRRAPKDRALLVAHADTVWKDGALKPSRIRWRGQFATALGMEGIGADDRAGIMVAWLFAQGEREHSILITTGEERGGIGARAAAKELKDELSQHAFAIEVDRAGDEEYVFYPGTHSQEFADWLYHDVLPGWDYDMGSFTDIAIICPAVGICGVNMAAGYLHEHTRYETLCLDSWERTLRACEEILEMPSYPYFEPDVIMPLNSKRDDYAALWSDLADPFFENQYIYDTGKKTFTKGVESFDVDDMEDGETLEEWLARTGSDDDYPWWEK